MNPWALLGIVIALVCVGGSGFFYGQHVQKAEDNAAQVDAVHQAILDYDTVAQADKEKAVKQASVRAKAAAEANTLQGAGNAAIQEQPLATNCDWSDKSYGVLLDAIQRANDKATSKPSMPNAMPGAKPAR